MTTEDSREKRNAYNERREHSKIVYKYQIIFKLELIWQTSKCLEILSFDYNVQLCVMRNSKHSSVKQTKDWKKIRS